MSVDDTILNEFVCDNFKDETGVGKLSNLVKAVEDHL